MELFANANHCNWVDKWFLLKQMCFTFTSIWSKITFYEHFTFYDSFSTKRHPIIRVFLRLNEHNIESKYMPKCTYIISRLLSVLFLSHQRVKKSFNFNSYVIELVHWSRLIAEFSHILFRIFRVLNCLVGAYLISS